jgi:hypothetical protein
MYLALMESPTLHVQHSVQLLMEFVNELFHKMPLKTARMTVKPMFALLLVNVLKVAFQRMPQIPL